MQVGKTVMLYKVSNSKYYGRRLVIEAISASRANFSARGEGVVLRDVPFSLFREV